MSLRALSSFVNRRFSPRRIAAAQAETIGSTSRRPTHSLHTLSNPDAAVGARRGALAVAGAGAGLAAALVGILYLQKDDKVGQVTNEGASNNMVVTDMGAALFDPAIKAMFTDKDGNVAWMEYNDYLAFRAHCLERRFLERRKTPVADKEAGNEVPESRKLPLKRVGNVMKVDEAALKKRFEEVTKKLDEEYKNNLKMVMEQEYKVDEAEMKKRFEDWMKDYGRTYKNEKEKARRYEVFKANAIRADKLNTNSSARFGPGKRADWTDDEYRRLHCRQGDFDWKSYFEDMKRFDSQQRQELDCTDAVKKRYRELRARKVEQERQANKH